MDNDPLIWTRDDIVRFTYEPDSFDRGWAWGWLHRHHPEEARRHVARALRDPSPSVAASGLTIFTSGPTPDEAHAALEELRLRTDLAPTVRARLDHPERPAFHDPLTDAIERLSLERAELRRLAPVMLRNRDIDIWLVALGAIGNQQHQWASDILIDAMPVLLTRGDPAMLWDTWDQLRDPRALPALAAAWTPGERTIADLYARIHRLARSTDALPSGIARDADDERRRLEDKHAVRERDPEAARLGPRRLQIRCAACGRTGDYDYAVEAMPRLLQFDRAAKRGEKLPSEPLFACKHCGAKNAYEVGHFSTISAVGGVRALTKSKKKRAKPN